jgi:hypothetical protein
MQRAGWAAICSDCLGSVGSLVELLQGKLSKHVMERVCRKGDGLFPSPREIKKRCSCPDSASMCKHIAAVLYGVGARLDAAPDMLFALRGVDRSELISSAATELPIGRTPVASDRIVGEGDLAALFGIDMELAAPEERPSNTAPKTAASPAEPGTPEPAPSRARLPVKGAGTARAVAAKEAPASPVSGPNRSRKSCGCAKYRERSNWRRRRRAHRQSQPARKSRLSNRPRRRRNRARGVARR